MGEEVKDSSPVKRNVAVILLYDKDKKVLLQHRAEDAERLPGYWAFFGGGIERGETPEQAVRRETLEELEYPLEKPRLVLTQEFTGSHNVGTKYVFVEEYDPKKELVLREGKEEGWFRLEETERLKIIDHDREVLRLIDGKL